MKMFSEEEGWEPHEVPRRILKQMVIEAAEELYKRTEKPFTAYKVDFRQWIPDEILKKIVYDLNERFEKTFHEEDIMLRADESRKKSESNRVDISQTTEFEIEFKKIGKAIDLATRHGKRQCNYLTKNLELSKALGSELINNWGYSVGVSNNMLTITW